MVPFLDDFFHSARVCLAQIRMNPWYRLATFKTALGVARSLPRGLTQFIASGIGRVSYTFNEEARGCLERNLEVVTGLRGRELDALCKANFSNFLKMLADYFFATGAEPARIRALLSEWRGYENLSAAVARGRGAIVVTAHL